MVMVIFTALVPSLQSTSRVASAPCFPCGHTPHAPPCLKKWRGIPDLSRRIIRYSPVRAPPRAQESRYPG